MLLVTRDNEMRAEGREEGLKEGLKEGREEGRAEAAKGMYETGLSLDVIACSLKTTVDAVKKMLGTGQEPFALG